MATLYSVTTSQLIAATVLSALISAGSVVGYSQFKERQSLPLVETTSDEKCVKVINYKNGDAYNCEDVDVLLRQYKKAVVSGVSTTESLPSDK